MRTTTTHHNIDGTEPCNRELEQCNLFVPLCDITLDRGRLPTELLRVMGRSYRSKERKTHAPAFFSDGVSDSLPTSRIQVTYNNFGPGSRGVSTREPLGDTVLIPTHVSQRSARLLSQCHSPPLGRVRGSVIRRLWIGRRTSDDDNLALGALAIDEELVIRNRGGHVYLGLTVSSTISLVYVPSGCWF
jgi:hypothetical protein